MAMTYPTLIGGKERSLSTTEARKLAFARNPRLRLGYGLRVPVRPGTKVVYLPRQNHSAKSVFTEADEAHLHSVGDLLEPCIVRRGAHGFGLHECKDHNGRVPGQPVYYIEETTGA